MKWALYRHLAKEDVLEFGFIAFPTGMGDEYFQELTAERRVLKKSKTGEVSYVWEPPDRQRNEALDTMLQAEAAAIKYGVRDMAPGRWDQIERERAAAPGKGQMDLEDMLTPTNAPAPPPPAPAVVSPDQPKKRKLSDIGG
jgi:phage terminase large subunit GpA-like protein